MRPVRSPSLPAALCDGSVRPRVNEENRTPCEVGHVHPPPSGSIHQAGNCAPKYIREVLTLRLPRCERGALPLSYGCVEYVLAAGLEPAQSELKSRARPSAPPALGRPASCRTRPSAVSERRRHRLTPGPGWIWRTQGVWKPDLRRVVPALASELRVRGGHGWFRSTASHVSGALSQLSYTTIEPAPGLDPDRLGYKASAHPVGPGRHFAAR